MLQLSGWLGEKTGKLVNKAIFCRRLDGGRLRRVKEVYFGDADLEVKYAKNKKALVSPALYCYESKNVRVQYRDFETGEALNFSGLVSQILSPAEFDAVTTAGGVKRILLGGGLDLNVVVWLVAGLGIGLFAGYVIAGMI